MGSSKGLANSPSLISKHMNKLTVDHEGAEMALLFGACSLAAMDYNMNMHEILKRKLPTHTSESEVRPASVLRKSDTPGSKLSLRKPMVRIDSQGHYESRHTVIDNTG